MEIKIGDKVRLKETIDIESSVGASLNCLKKDKVYIVDGLENYSKSFAVSFEDNDYYYDIRAFEIVESYYEIGKKYVLSDYKDDLNDDYYCSDTSNQNYILAYLPNAFYPFVAVTDDTTEDYLKGREYDTVNYKYAKGIPNFKPYEYFNGSWIGETIISNVTKQEYTIVGEEIDGKVCCRCGTFCYGFTFKELLDGFTWENGSRIGKIDDN